MLQSYSELRSAVFFSVFKEVILISRILSAKYSERCRKNDLKILFVQRTCSDER